MAKYTKKLTDAELGQLSDEESALYMKEVYNIDEDSSMEDIMTVFLQGVNEHTEDEELKVSMSTIAEALLGEYAKMETELAMMNAVIDSLESNR